MIDRIARRLAYLGFLLHPRFWSWALSRLDYLVTDHVRPWTRLTRGRRSIIHPSVSFRWAENITLGTDTRVQPGCVLWASPKSRITIGNHTGLGPGTMIFSSNHRYSQQANYHEQQWEEADVTIGRDVWMGAGSTIVAGVTIGDGCVVAAGSVVTRDLPPNSVAAGVPARVIGNRPSEPSNHQGRSMSMRSSVRAG
jgi:acetyltransferase-like isoleucine patch superfamily enzyme